MKTKARIRKRLGLVGVAAAVALLSTGCVLPLTGPGTDSLDIGFDLEDVGYQRAEHLIIDNAVSYSAVAPLTSDGKWQAEPVASTPAGNFATRFVVYRPIDPADFNGTVVVEWMNVTAGSDVPVDWSMAHNEFIREGFAYVGVSAQAVGVNQLKSSNPARYKNLIHPGDSYSYDIFTKIGRAIESPEKPEEEVLGGLTPERMIAAGESQSASRLVTYINAVHPLVDVYDGFMVHSRGASASSLSQTPLPAIPAPSPAPIRDDLDVPVMVVQAEGDVINANLGTRQADTPLFRGWEMAGTSHYDAYSLFRSNVDTGDGTSEIVMLDYLRSPPVVGCGLPMNAGPHHWILQAAYHHLNAWVSGGPPPPIATPLEVESTSPTVLARDPYGNALGGVRSPHVDAPLATLLGSNTGGGFCALFGSTTPLTPQQVLALYPTHAAFVSKWVSAMFNSVGGGFLLPPDATLLYEAAAGSTIPN